MGGASIFRVKEGDPNLGVIAETLTEHGTRYCMAQNYLPAIKDGDKRVLVVDGEPVPYCPRVFRRGAKPVAIWLPVVAVNLVR